jgi:polyhydroxyalkanoate synthesis regulator phasin
MSNTEAQATAPVDNSTVTSYPIGSPRNVVLACIGLASLLAEEIPALLERSVQRGSAVVEQAQTQARQRRAAAPRPSDEWPIELSRRGVPTHRDFEALMQQVAELERQIDQIAEQRSVSP